MEQATGTTIVSQNHGATMNWGAILGGSVVAMGMVSLMYTGGLAAGYTWIDAPDAAAIARGIGAGTAIWIVASWGVSLFIGGLFASWFDGNNDETVGTLHGITVWGLCISACSLLSVGRFAHMFQGAFFANNATSYTTMVMCIAFFSILVSLLASAAGGWLGANHIHKIHHLRRYQAPGMRPL